MKRVYWKKSYVDLKFLVKSKANLKRSMSWNSRIVQNFIGKTFLIYNGKFFVCLQVQKSMVGRKFGEFHFTWKAHRFKKK